MNAPLQAVFFDVDGVLIDSLPQHLQICRDKAKEFNLGIRIPSVDEFRDLIRRGTKVSPMRYFFQAVGFPENLLDHAVAAYQKEFMERYRPTAFPGVTDMLTTLRDQGLELGLVTSNTKANVVPPLRDAIEYFDERCLFFFDKYVEPRSKVWCLTEAARILSIDPGSFAYVGDQPADAAAASEAGTRFLGVTYGWGISREDQQFNLVDTVSGIPGALTSLVYNLK